MPAKFASSVLGCDKSYDASPSSLATQRPKLLPQLRDARQLRGTSKDGSTNVTDGARSASDRVLKALDDPHMAILGHPTGRLLLTREPYAIDMDAVMARAGACGVAIELNADPHRLDLDWRLCRSARRHGVRIEIGPDAHSVDGLENMALGIGMARKGWLAADDVINTASADDLVAFATRRRLARADA